MWDQSTRPSAPNLLAYCFITKEGIQRRNELAAEVEEEVGEAMREANGAQFAETEGERMISRDLLKTELVQVAAVCVQIIEAPSAQEAPHV